MAKYKTSIITSKGQELMAKATSGEAKLNLQKQLLVPVNGLMKTFHLTL